MKTYTLLVCLLLFLLIGAVAGVFGPLAPELAVLAGVPVAYVGMLRGGRQAGSLLSQLPGGWLTDRWGPRPVMVAGCVILGAGAAGTALVGGLAPLLVTNFAVGIGVGLLEVAPNVTVSVLYRSAAVMSLTHAAYGIGGVLSPGITVWSGGVRGTHLLLVVGFVLVGLMSLGVGGIRAEKRVGADQGRVVWRTLAPLLVLVFLYNGLEFGIGDWLYTSLMGNGLDKNVALEAVSVYWLALTIGQVALVPLVRVIEKRLMLFVGFVWVLVGAVLLVVARDPAGVWLGAVLVGFGLAEAQPIIVLLAAEGNPGAEGRGIGWLGVASSAGAGAVPALQGLLGLPLVMGVGLVCVLLSGSLMRSFYMARALPQAQEGAAGTPLRTSWGRRI